MEKREQNIFSLLFVLLLIGIVMLVLSKILAHSLPDGCVITYEYVKALKWNYVSKKLGIVAFGFSLYPFVMIIVLIINKIRRSYFTTLQKVMFVVVALAIFGPTILAVPNLIRVAFGKPSAGVETILGKGTTYNEAGSEKPAFLVTEGYVAVDSTMYSIYQPTDKIIVISCGGVPLEVHQAEVWSIDEELL